MKSGSFHWLAQRITAVALVPLGLWFVISFVSLLPAPYEQAQAWLMSPWNVTFAILFILIMSYHGALGMQVVWEDYVPRPRCFIFLTNGLSLIFAIASVGAILKVFL